MINIYVLYYLSKRPIVLQCGDVPINEHTLGAVNAALFPRVTSLWEAETGLGK